MLIVTVSKHESIRIGGAVIRVVKDGSRLRWYIDADESQRVFLWNDGEWTPVKCAEVKHDRT